MTLYPNNSGKEVNQNYIPPTSTKRRFIEIPAEGIVCVPIMRGADTIGERRIDLSAFPTVDAVEVVHGRWEPHYETFDADMAVGILGGNYQTGWQCSVCGRYESSKEPYCNCGAKMDGDMNGHPGCQMEL